MNRAVDEFVDSDQDDDMLSGGYTDIDEEERPWLEALANATFAQLSQIYQNFHYTLDSISSVKKQIVSGIAYEFELDASNNGRTKSCILEIYIESWTGTINTKLTCSGTDYNIASKVTKTNSRRNSRY